MSFPILTDPSQVFQLLLGQNATLMTFDAPTLGVDFQYSQFFPLPPFPVLGAELTGRLAAVAEFSFGFDTFGLNAALETGDPLRFFDGFYVSDRASADGTGADVPEVRLSGSLNSRRTFGSLGSTWWRGAAAFSATSISISMIRIKTVGCGPTS